MKHISNLFFAKVFTTTLFSLSFCSNGHYCRKIIDAKSADAIIGASIRLDEGAGAITDLALTSHYQRTCWKAQNQINYTGYAGKNIEDIDVKSGEVTSVDIAIEESAGEALAEAIVVAKARKESTSALTIFQKNSVSMATVSARKPSNEPQTALQVM